MKRYETHKEMEDEIKVEINRNKARKTEKERKEEKQERKSRQMS